MFLLPRSIYRGGLRSARVSRFIARPLRHTAPHHLQRGHCPPSLSHWTTYSGTDLAVASPRALHVARPVNHLSLSGSMLSETPGRRLRACQFRTRRMACAKTERIGTTQNQIILGAMFQIQGYTLHLAELVSFPSPTLAGFSHSTTGRLTRPYPERLIQLCWTPPRLATIAGSPCP